MVWYYVENAQQRGPIEHADFLALVAAGKVTADTLVWHEGLVNWLPYRDVPDFSAARPTPVAAPIAPQESSPPAAAPVPAGMGGLVCAECGKAFPPDQVMRLNDRWICVTCQPAYIERLKQGTTAGPSVAPRRMVPESDVRARDYEHDIGHYLGRAWELFKSDVPGFIVATFTIGFCIGILEAIAAVLANLANISAAGVAGHAIALVFRGFVIFLAGPLTGGLLLFYLNKMRGHTPRLGEVFSGFGPRFGQLVLGYVTVALLAGLALVPFMVTAGVVGHEFAAAFKEHRAASFQSSANTLMIGGALSVPSLCLAVYLQNCWMFTLWLIADKGLGFWHAMTLSGALVRKHWWQTFLLGIVAGLVTFAGVLCCLVGAFVTVPLAIGMCGYAYDRLFGDMQPAVE